MSDDTKPTLVPNPIAPDAPAAAPAAPAGNYFDKYDQHAPSGNYFDKYDLPPGVARRGALGEIGNQLKAGVLVDLPKMAGQAIQYTSDPGRPVYEFGKSIADYARRQEARPDLQPQEAQHGVVTNALAAGARMIPQSIVPAVGVGLAASGVGAPAGAALLAGSVLGAAPAGMAQAEDTLEKARAKGISDDIAIPAARKTGLIEWGGETIGNYLGGKMFGLAGRAIGKSHAGTAAEQALEGATNTQVLKPWLRQLPETVIGEVGTEMGQNAGEAYVEKQAGIDDHAPWDAAKEAIGPTLGMTALLAPFGLAGMGVNAHRQQQRNAVLTSPDADQNARTRIMDEIAPEIAKVDPQAAANFRANAARAISTNQPIQLDKSLFDNPNAPPPAALASTVDPDDPSAGTEIAPSGPMASAAAKAQPLMPLRNEEMAQKQADSRTRETGLAHEVVPHPTVPGSFAVRPVANPAQDANAAPVAEAPPAMEPAAPSAPVNLQPGEPVQVTLNGVDQFEHGTRIVDLSDDGQYAMVEGSDAAVPVASLTRLDPAAAAAIDEGAHQAATSPHNDRLEPTPGQQEAGNYKKGSVTLHGLDLSIENPAGSTRKGVDRDGTPWETTMAHHYGYIRGTNGADNEHIDAYVGPNPASHHVFVVDQVDPTTGAFDEHKVMLGFNSEEQARAAYDQHYAPDWKGGAHMTATTVDGLKQWMQGDTTEPFNPAALGLGGNDLFNTEQTAPAAVTEQAQPPAQSIDDLTKPIGYADARALVAGKTEKPGGTDPARQIDAGEGNRSTYRLGDVPLSMFKENEAGDLYDGTVNRDRAVEYSQRDPKGAPPVVAVVSPSTGKLNILDGGHRLTAARMRGDGTISTLISQKPAAAAETKTAENGEQITNDGPAVLGDDEARARYAELIQQHDEARTAHDHDKANALLDEPQQEKPEAAPKAEQQPQKRQWTYSDGTPAAPEDADLYQRAADAYQWALDQTPDTKENGLRREQLQSNVENPSDLREHPNDKGLKVGDFVKRESMDQLERIVSIKNRDVNGKTITEVKSVAPGGHGGAWGKLEWFTKVEQPQQEPQQEQAPAAGKTAPQAFDVNSGVGASATSQVVDGKRRSKDPDAPKDSIEAMLYHWAWMHATSRGYNAVLDFWNRADQAGRARLQALLDKQGELSAGHSQLYESAHQSAKIAHRDQQYYAAQKQVSDQIEANSDKYVERVRAEAEALFKQAPEAPKAEGKPAGVDYPNRHLGFQKARSTEDDAYHPEAWANIAAANMQVGDTFTLNGKQQTVESISDKTLKLKDADGKGRTLNPDGVAWGPFVRDLGDQLTVENLQAKNIMKPARPLIDILQRDPAVHVDSNGSVYLRDGGPVPAAQQEQKAEDKAEPQAPAVDKEREDRVKASREAGHTHLDQVEKKMVPMQGQPIYSVHDPKERGVTAGINAVGEVTVHWNDEYSAEKNKAGKQQWDGTKHVWQTRLKPDQLQDYVVGMPKAEAKAEQQDDKPAKTAQTGEEQAPAATEAEPQPGKIRSFTEDEKRAIAGISLGTGTQINKELELGMGNYIRPNTIKTLREKLLKLDPDKVRPYIDGRVREYERERAQAEPVVKNQQRVHVYNEKEAKPLLIIACSEEKLPGRHAVIDLYQGAMFDVLRKWLPKGAIDVYVLSAKYGLVRAEAVLQSYDEKMTAARQKELIAEGVVPSDFKGKNFSEVYIAGGQLYAPVAQVYAEQLRAAGFVGPDAKVGGTVGFIGQQRGQLGEYLRTVHERLGTLPEHPAPLEVGVRVRIKRLAKSPTTGVSLKDANRFAGRMGTVEREMIVGDSRYFIVNLDDTPDKVERHQEFHSNFLDVLTPAEQAGQAAPGELSQDPEKRKVQILERIDAALGKNAQLVAQADLFKTGNRFQDFRDEYKAAFDKVLVDMFNDKAIEARDVQMFTASFKDLPGYADRLARHFIDDHHGAENDEASKLGNKWGFTKEDTPKDGYFPQPETALKFDNKRSGKEQFSFEIQVAPAPNGRWAVSFGYQQGGQTGNATGIGITRPALTSEAHRSRMLAVEAGGEAIRQYLAANGKESLRTTGNILTAITKLKLLDELREKAAALAARAEAAGAQKLAGQIREVGRDMQPDDANLTRKRVDETIAGREKLVRAAETRAAKKAAEKAAKAEPKANAESWGDVETGDSLDVTGYRARPFDSKEEGNATTGVFYAETEAGTSGYGGTATEVVNEKLSLKNVLVVDDKQAALTELFGKNSDELGQYFDAKDDEAQNAERVADELIAPAAKAAGYDAVLYKQDTDLYGNPTRSLQVLRDVPLPKQDAPGTRRYPQAVRTAVAERLQKVLDGFTADRNTREGGARMIVRSAIEELGKEKTVINLPDQLREASGRLFKQFKLQAEVLDEIADQLDAAENQQEPAPEDDGALAGNRPMSPKQFETDLKNHGKVRFGEATFEVKPAGRGGFGRIQADTYVVDVSYPHSNKVIGFQQNLSLQQAVEAARVDAFDWWDNRRVKEAEFAKKREKLVRAGQRELFGLLSKDATLMKDMGERLSTEFPQVASARVKEWVAKEKAAGNLDADRRLMLDNLVIGGKTTLPQEFYDSLYKYLKRAARRAEKELDRDPAVYHAELIRAAAKAGIASDRVALFKAGFDHALAGKTKSTLPPVSQMQQGYEAGADWMKTDEGEAWFTGKRGKKLENTGAALRRWFDESSRKIKEVTSDNLPASYEIIKAQASRVEAFADVAGEGATPGTKRYILAVRDSLRPFQEWLLDSGPLGSLYGEIGYRESDSFKIARFLDGRAYTYREDAAGKRTSMEDASPQDRLELLQEAAAEYNARLRGLAEALSGATTVQEAAERYQDYLVKEKDGYVWSSTRLTEAGKQLHTIMRDSVHKLEPGYHVVNDLIKTEKEPDAPANRKQALLVPKLDRIVREGEHLADHRAGRDVTPQQMKETFGFADVGFGRYVAAKQDQDHLNYAFDAFMDLANLLGIRPKDIGLGGTLHFTIGALGHGRHAAHFQAMQPHPDGGTVPVINVTNTKGDGTVAHEWFHALDHVLSAGWSGNSWKQGPAVAKVVQLLAQKRDLEALAEKVQAYAKGRRYMRRGGRKTPIYDLKSERGLIENAKSGLNWEAGQQGAMQTNYKREADTMGEDYWGNPRELLARAAEAWVHDTLGGVSNYLVNPGWVGEGKIKAPQYKGAPYPMGEERKLFNDAIGALVKSLRFTDSGVTVDMETFDKQFPDVGRQFKEGYAALEAQIPSMVRAHLAQKEAAALAAEYAKDEAQRAAQEQARAAKEAREKAERDAEEARLREQLEKQQQQAAEPPAGPLSEDDLEALFDQAENELAEEQQEQPEAKAPGEASQLGHWTREDIEFLIKSHDAGSVFLLADPSLGLPTIHDMPSDKTRHIGFGTFETKTDRYEALWDGGGEMKKTPGGQSYTLVSIKDGRGNLLKDLDWDNAKTKLQARLIVKSGPKAAPTLSAEQEKSAARLVAEAAKLGVSGVEEAMKGLIQLFGGNSLKSFPAGFDEESYKAAKPHFEKALERFQAAGQTLVDLFKLLISHFGPGIRPYAIHFAKEKGLSANLAAPATATEKIAGYVQKALAAGETISSKTLFEHADKAFGGTQAEGKYSVKDAYDAMEAGMNRHIMDQRVTPDGSSTDAVHKIEQLDKWTRQLATQTRRTEEMDEYQQFSTPPSEAFAAAWLANIRPGESFLEPSAGTGSLAIYAQLAGARVTVNELSSRRADVLKAVLPEAQQFQENAEQLDNILPDAVKPSVIVMNPPFSSTAGRVQGERDTMNGGLHIEQALKRLQEGGRLVAIVGSGMAADRPAFKSWWKKISAAYNVRVNITVDGSNYAKYGTTFDNQILVIDKTGPTTGTVVTGQVQTLAELPALLEGIRNDRKHDESTDGAYAAGEPDADQQGGDRVPAGENAAGDRAGSADADPLGAGQRDRAGAGGTRAPGPGADDGAGQRDGNKLGAEKRGQVPDEPGKRGGHGADGRGTGGLGNSGGRRGTADRESVQRDGGQQPVAGEIQIEAADNAAATGELSDAIFESYTPQRLKIPGAKAHPGKLVQSSAMAAVEPPSPTYTPNLPKNVIDYGMLSIAQLEAVVYAGQAHSEMLPGDKERRGFFIGDGTGVGKGREIAGILLDNQRQGRNKAVWISAKQGLLRDAKRDFAGVTGNPDQILPHNKFKADVVIDAKSGILFTTYDTLRSGALSVKDRLAGKQQKAQTRLQQIVDWLGADFDGVIAFDEAHNMGNVVERKGKRGKTKPAAKALAGVELQRLLPKARIVYVSATGATEVHNLGYATRLGLWGEGSAFAKVTDFIGGIESGGVAAMELVSRDMKAQGSYLARSLSFDGVTYDRLEHELTPLQTDIYNELARAWQTVLQNIDQALEATGQKDNPKAKSAALAQFWGSHQRFFNHVITAMQMPSIVEAAERDLAEGHAVVMQLVNTNEAEQERQAAKLANDDDAVAEDFDFTPRETLLNYVRNSFPVQQHEEYTDDEGHKQTRPVVDSKGNPVFNKEMVALRDQLVKNLEQIRVPDNPLDMILRAFGTNNVAEITGRKRRFVQVQDAKTGGFTVVEEKRPASSVPADADAFMADKKRVLVFSDAGGTGYSFQSDLLAENQRRRIHYLVQPGWRANNAVQGFGRTHRSNEANQPHYVLPTTNLKAQKRFISSIARRLDQLGALTKGQRETGGQGMFSATDNLESQYATDALQNLFVDMYNGQAALNFHETTRALGLNGLINVETGALNYGKLPDVPQFLNRLLSLETNRQDEVFEEFFRRLEETIARAKAQGTFDAGMETLRADKVEKLRDEVVYEDKRTGARTRYVELELTHPTHINRFEEAQRHAASFGERFLGFFRNERTGKVFALARTGTSTDARTGMVVSRGVRIHTTGGLRYGDEVDKILKGARGETTVNKKIQTAVYTRPSSDMMTESYTNAAGKLVEITDARLAGLLAQRGLDRVEQTIEAGPPGPERDAFRRLLDRMRPHLKDSEAERAIPTFQRLTPEQAKMAWEAEIAATPPTYTDKTHLLTGMLLPIWDRLPGDPRVVRTQTVDGERLLGRVVSERNLDQTLKNLGVGNNLSKLPAAKVLERLMEGQRGILANGWLLHKVRVSNDNRIEITGQSLQYNRAEREMLTNLGAFVERINWAERTFIPTGEKGVQLLTKLLEYKPLVELGKPGESQQDDEAEFSRGRVAAGMARADVQKAVAPIVQGWHNAPRVTVVQSVNELPFKAPADTRGATYQGQVFLVADNLAHAGEVQFVLAHEALGHIGLSAILGKEALTRELNRLRLINPALAEAARKQAATFGYDLNLATEEALADLAGSGATIKGWQKFVALVQQGLRAIGLDRVADWLEGKTQAETMALLARAREAIEGSKAPRTFGSAEAARFSDGAASPWYSQLARQIERLPQKSATALQWAETIMASGFAQKGVKQDEITWSGILDYLEGRNGAKVTKAELLDYLAENGVRVTETMHTEDVPEPTEEGLAKRQAVIDRYEARLDDLQERILDDDNIDNRLALQEEWSDLIDQRNIEADLAYRLPSNRFQRPRYASYTLPGGENNRELLLTLPQREPSFKLDDYIGELSDKYGWHVEGNYRRPGWVEEDLTADERARLKQLQEESLKEYNERTRDAFQSSHWDQKNVLAHVRFNDRTDSEGKRVLHVEELQSDWGQIAKRDGFRDDPVPPADLDAAARAAREVLNRNDNLGFEYTIEAMSAVELSPDWKQLGKLAKPSDYAIVEYYRQLYHQDKRSRMGVPRGPFVDKTEAWLNLALKRVMIYAAENDYDRVSFVTGQQAVDRFKLSQQVKAVEVEKALDEPGYRVNITLLDGELHETWANDDKDLANLMGKELAAKAVEQIKADPFSAARFTGDNLNLGGHGMRAFYDQIVPNAVNKLMKQLGGGRMDEGEILHSEPYDPRPGVTNYVGEDGQLAYANHGVPDRDFGQNNYYGNKGWSTQPAIDITDAMRERIAGGLPLFKLGDKDRLAPNGKPSNLPAHLWEQVRTPEFKAWFGDWEKDPQRASKVVDENGEPRVVFHGTHADFMAFDKTKIRQPGGFWFAERHDYVDNISREGQEGFNQMPVFLNIRKPADGARYALLRKGEKPFDNTAVQRNMKLMGHDGVRLDNGRDSTWIAAEPGQIKSAIANAGSFDRTNADIRFSRGPVDDNGPLPVATDEGSLRLSRATPEQLARQVGSTLKASTVTRLGNALAHYRSIGLQFLGRLQLTELYGKLFPQGNQPNMMQIYSDLAARMDAEKTEGGTKADGIVDDWAKLKDEKDLAKLMHDETRLEIDASKDYVTGDSYKDWKALRKRWDALSPEAKRIHEAAARMYEKHYEAVRQAVKDRIARSLTAHKGRAALIRRLEQEFFSRKIKGVYFPLARFGDYVITVRFVGKNPQPGQAVVREAVVFAETLNQAEAERKRLLAEYPAARGYEVLPVTKRAEYNAARDSVGRGFIKKLFNALDEAGIEDPSLQDTINQLILHSMPDLSFTKTGIHRTGMPGFSQDARRAFAHHMLHGVSYLAKLNYSDQLANTLDGMQKYVNDHAEDPGYDQVKAQQVVDEMNKRHDSYLNPKGNALSTKLTSLGFVWFLGASPASAMANLLQTPTVAYPLLGGKFGFGKAAAALIAASQEAVAGHNDMGKVLKGDEKKAYEAWVRSGLVDLTMTHDLAGVASGRDNQLHGHMREFMRTMSFMFHHAERFNRQATALAAYRLARDSGMGHDEAYHISVQMTKAAHFDYSAGNRPRFMQGPVAQVVFLFKQYAQNLIFTFARNAVKSFQGDKEAMWTLSGLLVTHAIAAGIIGLPLVTTLLGAASMIGGSDDEPWDAEIALRRLLADLFGETAGQVIAHGITRPTPFDISGRVGADHLIFPDVQEGLQGEKAFDAYLAGLLGPVVGIFANLAKATAQWGRGDVTRAVETMLPAAAKGPWRAGRYYTEGGAKDRNGIVIDEDIDGWDYLSQVLGFSSGPVRDKQEAKSAIYNADQALQRRRHQLMDAYARKQIKHEDTSEEMDAIRAFNREHPNRVIAGLHLAQSVRNRVKHNLQAKQGIYLPVKRGMDARKAGDFADGDD